jgi:hypothetical protein
MLSRTNCISTCNKKEQEKELSLSQPFNDIRIIVTKKNLLNLLAIFTETKDQGGSTCSNFSFNEPIGPHSGNSTIHMTSPTKIMNFPP